MSVLQEKVHSKITGLLAVVGSEDNNKRENLRSLLIDLMYFSDFEGINFKHVLDEATAAFQEEADELKNSTLIGPSPRFFIV